MNVSSASAFESWAARQKAGTKPMTDRSLHVYRSMWNAFSEWLQRENRAWTDVDRPLVLRFLSGPVPSAKQRRPLNPSTMSHYHRQRYWRVLHGVYGEALRQQWMPSNPAGELSEQERPHMSAGARQPQVLPPGMLALLRSPKVVCRILAQRDEHHWMAIRDRAIVALSAHVGLTAAELVNLCGQDLWQGQSCLIDAILTGDQLSDSTIVEVTVNVRSSKDFMGRSLVLSQEAMASIWPWLQLRKNLLDSRTGALAGSARYYLHRNSPLFLSQKGLASMVGQLPTIETTSLYTLIKRAITALYELPEARRLNIDGSGARTAQGPAIIRNSVIKEWLENLGVQETLLRAGLTRAHSLGFPVPAPAPAPNE